MNELPLGESLPKQEFYRGQKCSFWNKKKARGIKDRLALTYLNKAGANHVFTDANGALVCFTDGQLLDWVVM